LNGGETVVSEGAKMFLPACSPAIVANFAAAKLGFAQVYDGAITAGFHYAVASALNARMRKALVLRRTRKNQNIHVISPLRGHAFNAGLTLAF
jgi:hypothetical protein